MQQRRADCHNITAAQVVPRPVKQMARMLVQKNAQLIKLMEMLKFHINCIGTFVPVKEIEKRSSLPVDFNHIFFFINYGIVNQHVYTSCVPFSPHHLPPQAAKSAFCSHTDRTSAATIFLTVRNISCLSCFLRSLLKAFITSNKPKISKNG